MPAEVGGYSTNAMNAVYNYWLQRQVAEAAHVALERAAPKPLSQAEGNGQFALRSGPVVSARTVWQDSEDRYAFHFVCPRAADARGQPPGQFLDYLNRIKSECVWQVSRAVARFSLARRELGQEQLRPDFARFAELLRKAGITRINDGDIPGEVFRALGDPAPILEKAVEIDMVSATQCPSVADLMGRWEGTPLKLDLENVGAARTFVTPHHHPSIFQLQIPIMHGGNGSGKIDLTDLRVGNGI